MYGYLRKDYDVCDVIPNTTCAGCGGTRTRISDPLCDQCDRELSGERYGHEKTIADQMRERSQAERFGRTGAR